MQAECNIKRISRFLTFAMVTLSVIVIYMNTDHWINNTGLVNLRGNFTTKAAFPTKSKALATKLDQVSFNDIKLQHSLTTTDFKHLFQDPQAEGAYLFDADVGPWRRFKPWSPVRWSKPIISELKLEHLARKSLITRNIRFSSEDKQVYDVMNMKPIRFNNTYKNPCWNGSSRTGLLSDGKLHCLPYFYIIGVKKSGTTDLYARLLQHPEIIHPGFKESQWLSRLRFGHVANTVLYRQISDILRHGVDIRSVDFFVSLFDEAASVIMNRTVTDNCTSAYNKFITAEGSPSVFHMHTDWQSLPGNEGLPEPGYTNFHYIKHLTPQARIIVMSRDPVSRLYSDFLHINKDKYGRHSAAIFHRHASLLIDAYNNCLQEFSLRRCVFNNSLRDSLLKRGVHLAESFHAGFYAVLMREVYAVFSKDQVKPILMSDYITDLNRTLAEVFDFLKISEHHTEYLHAHFSPAIRERNGKIARDEDQELWK